MITLAVGATSIALHPDLYWSDEFTWNPVEQSTQYGTTGALIVQVAERQAGRPITLEPENERSAWCSRALMEQAKAWAAIPGQEMQLTLRGVTHTVIWRHGDNAISTRPIVHYNDTDPGDFYLATFRFLEI